MSQYSPYIVSGLVSGSILAIAALGLVLSYKTSGLLNFGHGALSAAGAYIFFDLNTRNHVPWPVAALLSVVLFGIVAGILMERMSRGLSGLATANRVVATVGLLIAIEQIAIIRYGATSMNVPHFLPTNSHKLAGVYVTDEQMIVFAIGLLAAIVLYLFFRFARIGRAMRAVVDDPTLLDVVGFDPHRVRRLAWIISCSFAALSGVLFAPEFVLDATLLTLLIVQAFSAAAIGMFSSLPLVYVGGLVVGVLQQVLTKFGAAHQALSGLPSSVPFLVLLVVLLAAGPRLRELGSSDRAVVGVKSMTGNTRFAASALAGVALVVVPWVTGTKLVIWTNGLTEVILFVSLGLLVRTAGMVSLCQVSFAAVGAAAFGHLAGQWGVPWLVALLLAGLFAVPFGAVVAIPAIRLSGLYMALATFAFGILVQEELYNQSFLFGSFGKVLLTPRPHVLGLNGNRGFYYVVLLVLAATVLLVIAIGRSRLGRLLRALSDSPTALAIHGTNTRVTRLLVFCTSAFIAGLSGAMFSQLSGRIDADSFDPLTSLILVAVLAVAGRNVIWSAFLASLAYFVIPGYISNATLTEYLGVIFGLAAIVASVAPAVNWDLVGLRTRFYNPGRRRSRIVARQVLDSPVKA